MNPRTSLSLTTSMINVGSSATVIPGGLAAGLRKHKKMLESFVNEQLCSLTTEGFKVAAKFLVPHQF